jgi:DNA transformation protein and related proteins
MSTTSPRPKPFVFEPDSLLQDVSALRNLGPRSTEMLAAIGVRTRDELARLGALGACERLMAAGHPVSLNMAYAIEGALMDCDWRQIPHAFRVHLVTEFRRLQRGRR